MRVTKTKVTLSESEQGVIRQAYDKLKPHLSADYGEPLAVMSDQLKQHSTILLEHSGKLDGLNHVVTANAGQVIDLGSAVEDLARRVTACEENSGGDRVVELVDPKGRRTTVKGCHKQFAQVLYWANLKVNVLMVGPAGTGKTYMARQVADALEMGHHLIPVNEQLYPSRLFGQRYADGQWKRTSFWEAYTGMADSTILGGHDTKHDRPQLVCFDELDRILPNTGCSLNAALSGDEAEFYDAMWPKDPAMVIVATANTHGDGLSNKYTGANNLDKSLLNRFVMVWVDYDPNLEREVYGDSWWLRYCQAVRAVCVTNNVQVDISMRQVQQGTDGLSGQFPGPVSDLKQQVIWERFQPKATANRVRALMESAHGSMWDTQEYWESVMAEEKKPKRTKSTVKAGGVTTIETGGEVDILEELLAGR